MKFISILIIAVLALVLTAGVASARTVSTITVGPQTGILTNGTAGSVTYLITVLTGGTSNLDVVLSVSSLPSGANETFFPATLYFKNNNPNPQNSTLTITTTAGTPVGSHNFTVNIVGTGRNLTVLDAPPSVISKTNNVYVANNSLLTLNATITDPGSGVKNATVNVSQVNSTINEAVLNLIGGYLSLIHI